MTSLSRISEKKKEGELCFIATIAVGIFGIGIHPSANWWPYSGITST
jgi:hypothetical protein